MGVYIIIVSTLVFIHLFEKRFSNKDKNIIIALIILALIVIQGLRSFSVGVDLVTYNLRYDQYSNGNIVWSGIGSEINYSLLNRAIHILEGNFRTVLFLTSILIFVPLGKVVAKDSKMPILSILLFVILGFFVFSLSGLRQTIAIGITLLSFKYIKKKRQIPFIILTVIAFGFHKSAIFFIIAYPAYHIKISRYTLVILPLVLLGVFVFRKPVFDALYYLYDETYTPTDTNAYNFLFMLLAFYVASVFIFWNRKSSLINGLMNMILISIFIQFFSTYSTIVMRIGYYFYIYLILLIPEQIKAIKDKQISLFYKWFVVIFLITFFIISVRSNSLGTYPYSFLNNSTVTYLISSNHGIINALF